jgi:class 3 adenylate cyclase
MAWVSRYQRATASPGTIAPMVRMVLATDVRAVLPAIRVPTLVLHRADDACVRADHGRYLADQIPGARYVELPGADHTPELGDADAIVAQMQSFLTGDWPITAPDRVLTTVMFTDIVGSTALAAELGDRRWKEVLQTYDGFVLRQLDRFRGRRVKSTGDGTLATVDGPRRAIACAVAIRDGVRALGLEVRAGLHAGEVELHGKDLAGIAVHLAERVCSSSKPTRCLSRERSSISWPAPASRSRTEVNTHSRACRGPGGCIRFEMTSSPHSAYLSLGVYGVLRCPPSRRCGRGSGNVRLRWSEVAPQAPHPRLAFDPACRIV